MPKTTLKLPLIKIKEFLDLCAKIDSAINIDILSTAEYLKCEIIFGECFLTKNTISSFVEFKFDISKLNIDDNEFLLHEEKLKDFCSTINSEYLYIRIEDFPSSKDIKISDTEKFKDSKKLNYNSSNIQIINFPKTKYRNETIGRTRIGLDVINSIQIASKSVLKDGLKPTFTCIYLGSFDNELREISNGNVVWASDMHNFYKKTFPNVSFKKIAIQPKEINVFDELKFVDYLVFNNHNIYFHPNGNIVFGFRHLEGTNGFGFSQFVNQKENSIEFILEDVLIFCTRAKKSSSSCKSYVNSRCEIELSLAGNNEGIATFFYEDKENNNEDIKECDIVIYGNGELKEFNINHNLIYDIIRSLPYRTIEISDNQYFLGITSKEDLNYFGFFTKVTI